MDRELPSSSSSETKDEKVQTTSEKVDLNPAALSLSALCCVYGDICCLAGFLACEPCVGLALGGAFWSYACPLFCWGLFCPKPEPSPPESLEDTLLDE